MRVRFNEMELRWLNAYFTAYAALASKELNRAKDGGALARLASGMKYKFTPNATTVYLNGKERALVVDLANYRQAKLESTGGLSGEVELVTSIIAKLEGSHGTN